MLPAAWVLALLLVVAAPVLTPAPARTAPGGAGEREVIVIGMTQEPDTLGRFSGMSAARVVENALFAQVAPFTDAWTRRPVLVETMPTLRNGLWELLPGGRMRVTWRVRRGFTWHDGRPVTALDFRFTFGVLRHPDVPGVSRSVLSKVDHVVVPDPRVPYALVVQWNEPYPFAGSLPFGEATILPRHVLEAPFRQAPARLPLHGYWRAPLGNGAYRFVDWTPGSHITVDAYDRFPLGRPRVRRLIFRFILDSAALQAAVLAGQVDATEINGFGVEEMVEIERRTPGVRAAYTPSLRWERIAFNMDHEWLRDRRVRRAIAHAVDREAMVRALFHGRYQVAHAWVAPRHPAYNASVRRYGYDPAAARALLTQAGFTPGQDGVLRDRSGKRVELTIMSTVGSAVREQIQEIVQQQLRAVGIELRIDNRPASVFLGPVTRRRQFPHLALWSTLFSLESTGYEGFHSSQVPAEANGWEGFNAYGWRNIENDRLLERALVELDESRRLALLRRQQDIFAEDLPALPLYFVPSLTTAPRWLRGVRPTGLFGSFLPWNAHEWSAE